MLAFNWDVTDPAAWGAFLTGVAAVLTARHSIRRLKKTDKDECDRRVEELERYWKHGYKEGLRVEPRHEREAS